MMNCNAHSRDLANAAHFSGVTDDVTPSGVLPADWYTNSAEVEPFYDLCHRAAADISDACTHIFAYIAEGGGTMTRRILRARTKGIYTILDQSSSAVKASQVTL